MSRRFIPSRFKKLPLPTTSVVLGTGFLRSLGLSPLNDASADTIEAFVKSQSSALLKPHAWLKTLQGWILETKPNVVNLNPDTVLDGGLLPQPISGQMYGFGVPGYVPTMLKPNGSVNWFQFLNCRLPVLPKGFQPLRVDGLACYDEHPWDTPFEPMPLTIPAVRAGRMDLLAFREIHKDARKRLETCTDILLLGVVADDLSPLDADMLRALQPSARLTVVCPSETEAAALRNACSLPADAQSEVGEVAGWVGGRLAAWSQSNLVGA